MKDLLIVGFGLAGLSIARHAGLKHKSFDILTNQSQLSSMIAGGLLNPVAIKRMKPVWEVQKFMPYAKLYYHRLDSLLDSKTYQNINIKVFIHHAEQENNWYEAIDNPVLSPFLSKTIEDNTSKSLLVEKLGEIKASIVHLNSLLSKAQIFFKQQQSFINQIFDYSMLKIYPDKISYNAKEYSNIVFCEGFGVCQNPYFNNLGIYGNKGDYIIIKSEHLKLDQVVKAKYFLIPLGDDLYKFGATYERESLTHKASASARIQLIKALEKMLDVSYEVVNQVCGIRPTTRDRRPVLGKHIKHNKLYIFNGFGSRGVMISPLLGKHLIDYIFDKKPLQKEVSIDRFYAKL